MDNDQANNLGRYLRAKRTGAGLSIRELARLAEVDHGYIIRLEGGQKRNPSAETLLKIAGVLELDASELLGLIGIKTPIAPSMEAVFRKHYGLTEEEAKEAAELIEKRYGKRIQTKGGDHDTKDKRTSDTE